MDITFTADGGGTTITLATETRGTGKWVGPDKVRRNGQRVTQTNNLVGAVRASHHERKNRSAVITFSAKCTCANVAEAVALALGYDDILPTGRGTFAWGETRITNAIITAVDANNVGVTVYADITVLI